MFSKKIFPLILIFIMSGVCKSSEQGYTSALQVQARIDIENYRLLKLSKYDELEYNLQNELYTTALEALDTAVGKSSTSEKVYAIQTLELINSILSKYPINEGLAITESLRGILNDAPKIGDVLKDNDGTFTEYHLKKLNQAQKEDTDKNSAS